MSSGSRCTGTSRTTARCSAPAAASGGRRTRCPIRRPGPAVEDPAERLEVALAEIYAWFGSTEEMTANVLRDIPESPVLQELTAPAAAVLAGRCRRVLEHGWEARGERAERLRAVIGHAIEFGTWRSLARTHGLDDAAAAELMVRLARVV